MIDQKTYYDKKADRFESGLFFDRSNRNHLKKIKTICELLNLNNLNCPDYSILEVGVGTGIHAKYLLMQYPTIKYTGIDISKGMINKAKEKMGKIKNVTLLVADGERLPFRDNLFDAAYISGSLHHFANPYLGLSELVRVVRRGGKMVIMEPNRLFPTNFLATICNKAERSILKMNKKNLRNWGVSVGLKEMVVTNHPVYTPPFPEVLILFYDKIDSIFSKIPILSSFSIMLLLKAEKQKEVNV